MKKILILMFVTIASLVALISCSKDDAPAPAAPAAPAATSTPTPCSGIVMGYATPVCTAVCYTEEYFQAIPVTVGGSAVTVNAITLAMNTQAAGISIRTALYSNHTVNQIPSVLLTQSQAYAAASVTLQTFSVPPVVLLAGEIYWIAFQNTISCLNMCRPATGRRFFSAGFTWAPFPAAAPAGSMSNTYQPVAWVNSCP